MLRLMNDYRNDNFVYALMFTEKEQDQKLTTYYITLLEATIHY